MRLIVLLMLTLCLTSGGCASAPVRQSVDRADQRYLTVLPRGEIEMDGQRIGIAQLGDTLIDLHGGDRNVRILMRASPETTYGDMMITIEALRRAGFHKVLFVAYEAVTEGE